MLLGLDQRIPLQSDDKPDESLGDSGRHDENIRKHCCGDIPAHILPKSLSQLQELVCSCQRSLVGCRRPDLVYCGWYIIGQAREE